MKVEGLNIHPLKSGRAIPLESAEIRRDGLQGRSPGPAGAA